MSAKGFSAVALFVAKFFRWKGNLRGATESPPSHVFLPQEITLPETNIAPENRQLEKEIPIENSPFSGASRPYLFRDYEAHHHAPKNYTLLLVIKMTSKRKRRNMCLACNHFGSPKLWVLKQHCAQTSRNSENLESSNDAPAPSLCAAVFFPLQRSKGTTKRCRFLPSGSPFPARFILNSIPGLQGPFLKRYHLPTVEVFFVCVQMEGFRGWFFNGKWQNEMALRDRTSPKDFFLGFHDPIWRSHIYIYMYIYFFSDGLVKCQPPNQLKYAPLQPAVLTNLASEFWQSAHASQSAVHVVLFAWQIYGSSRPQILT